MTEEYYRTGWHYKPDHTKYGGKIYAYDFDGYQTMASIAGKIISDKKFDEACKLKIENKKKHEKILMEDKNNGK